MRKATPPTPKPIALPPEPKFNPYFVIASVLTFLVPILVLPAILDNAFNTPKTVLMQLGVCVMAAVYSVQLFKGREVSILEESLYYNPFYTEAKEKLDEVNKVIQEHDKVLIKFK